MDMKKKEDFGGEKEDNKYCVHCCTPEGELKSKEEIRAGMIQFYMRRNHKTEDEAEVFVDAFMRKQSAWKK